VIRINPPNFSKFYSSLTFTCQAGLAETVKVGPTTCDLALGKMLHDDTVSDVTIAQAELERLVLDALQNNLMDQDALTIFCQEYAKERNRLQAVASLNRNAFDKELATTKKDHAELVDAIIAGIPAEQVKDRILMFDARRIELEGKVAREATPSPIRIHPSMVDSYEKIIPLDRTASKPRRDAGGEGGAARPD